MQKYGTHNYASPGIESDCHPSGVDSVVRDQGVKDLIVFDWSTGGFPDRL